VAELRGQPTTIEEAFACLQAEPRKYAAVYDEFLEYLSVGLAAAINLYNPGAIFLHTRWLEVNPELLGRLRQSTAARALGPAARDTELRPARSSKQHGAIAAIVQNVTNALASELD
jgi:predicted NBD/HSP70 family sugar kinase